MRIARCSQGRLGFVTGWKYITYPNGEKSFAWVGYHIWPLKWFGKRWSSRQPKWVLRIWPYSY